MRENLKQCKSRFQASTVTSSLQEIQGEINFCFLNFLYPQFLISEETHFRYKNFFNGTFLITTVCVMGIFMFTNICVILTNSVFGCTGERERQTDRETETDRQTESE